MTKDVSNILTEQQFLPRSPVVMRLLAIRDDPLSHFLPTKVTSGGAFFCVGPPGLAPELVELFMRPVTRGPNRRGTSPDKGPNKRPRLDSSVHEEEDIEQGRRAGSLAPSHALGSEIIGRHSIGPDNLIEFGDHAGGLDDLQLEVPEFDLGVTGLDGGRSKSVALSALSRLSTPAPDGVIVEEGDETYADASCPIAMFDIQPATQTQGLEKEDQAASHEGRGYSKNTVKALGIIRKELQPVVGEEEDKMLSFRKVSDRVCCLPNWIHLMLTTCQASRRAAASFFFELLVLGTRDCLKLSQAAPFENIEIRAKDKLWERQRHGSVDPGGVGFMPASRAGSVARSVGSNSGL